MKVTPQQWAGLAAAAALAGGIGLAIWFANRKAKAATAAAAADPAAAALEAGVTRRVYALGRVIASEAGSRPELEQIAVAWVVVNEADRRYGKKDGVPDVERLILAPDGAFGAQNVGKFVSSRLEGKDSHRALAKQILSGAMPDPTGGATQFDSPRAQRALVARGTSGYTKTPEQVADARRSEGKALVIVPGIDPDQLRFWRKVA